MLNLQVQEKQQPSLSCSQAKEREPIYSHVILISEETNNHISFPLYKDDQCIQFPNSKMRNKLRRLQMDEDTRTDQKLLNDHQNLIYKELIKGLSKQLNKRLFHEDYLQN